MSIMTVYYRTREDGVVLMKTYSSEGRYIVNDKTQYTSAIEPIDNLGNYIEGDLIPIEENKKEG